MSVFFLFSFRRNDGEWGKSGFKPFCNTLEVGNMPLTVDPRPGQDDGWLVFSAILPPSKKQWGAFFSLPLFSLRYSPGAKTLANCSTDDLGGCPRIDCPTRQLLLRCSGSCIHAVVRLR